LTPIPLIGSIDSPRPRTLPLAEMLSPHRGLYERAPSWLVFAHERRESERPPRLSLIARHPRTSIAGRAPDVAKQGWSLKKIENDSPKNATSLVRVIPRQSWYILWSDAADRHWSLGRRIPPVR